nr:hypothetical protein [Tanacetum cinerariifolium]
GDVEAQESRCQYADGCALHRGQDTGHSSKGQVVGAHSRGSRGGGDDEPSADEDAGGDEDANGDEESWDMLYMGAATIYKEVEKSDFRVAIARIPKTIDNNITDLKDL